MIKIEILWYNIQQLLKIVTPFILAFIIIPVAINPNKLETALLKVVKGITLSIFVAICVVYFLTSVKLFNIFPLTIIYFPLLFITFAWIEGINIKRKLFSRINFKSLNHLRILPNIAVILVFLYIFYLRGRYVLNHLAIYYFDTFFHLVQLKAFLAGNFNLGILHSPMGQEAIIGFLKIYSSCDPMDIYRIIGPLQSTLILFTLYFLVSEVTKNRFTALFITTISGMDVSGVFPNVFYRQITGFHQEFALIFLLPIVYFAIQYMSNKHGSDLKYFIISICNTLFIHPYISLIAMLLFIGIFVTGIILKLWKKKTVVYIFISGGLIAAVGLLPPIIWSIIQNHPLPYSTTKWAINFCMSKDIFSNITSFDYFSFLLDMLNPVKDPIKWHNPLSANIIIYCILISLVYIFWRILARKSILISHVYVTALAIGQIILVILYYGKGYRFPEIIHYERVALALNLISFSLAGILLNEMSVLLRESLKSHQILLHTVGKVTLSVIVAVATTILPQGEVPLIKLQHEGALRAYIKIRDDFPNKSWTIISPTEEYALALDYGWHYEACKFPIEFSMEDARDRNFSFDSKIPSKNIFIFAEKNPLLIWSSLPKDKTYYSEWDEPYRLYKNRKKIEDYICKWMQEYINSHHGLPNNAKIFYEDKDLIVYHITS